MTDIEPALPVKSGSRKRGSGSLETPSRKKVSFADPPERMNQTPKQVTIMLSKDGARFQFEKVHGGQPRVVDLSKTKDVLAICEEHTIYDIVVTAMAQHDEETMRQFLDYDGIGKFIFIYPGGNIFLPKWHLIVLREAKMVLDDVHNINWQPQILFTVDENGLWMPTTAIISRSEAVGDDMMLRAMISNVDRKGMRSSEFNRSAGEIASKLSEDFLTYMVHKVKPIVEVSDLDGEALSEDSSSSV